MSKDKKYPIYGFKVDWVERGRRVDGKYWREMFKEEQTQEQLDAYVKHWWSNFQSRKRRQGIPVRYMEYTAEFIEKESWVLTWFTHETFDVGQSDAEALASFETFVQRKELQNNESDKEVYCLMGAEDRWRWRGLEPSGSGDEQSRPPCRCKYCKKAGKLRIAH